MIHPIGRAIDNARNFETQEIARLQSRALRGEDVTDELSRKITKLSLLGTAKQTYFGIFRSAMQAISGQIGLLG